VYPPAAAMNRDGRRATNSRLPGLSQSSADLDVIE
jgi:hypothetical protein